MSALRVNAASNVLSRLITAVLWLAVTPYVLGRLGSERFGVWALFFAFLSSLLAFDLGLQSTMMRFVASARGRRDGHGLQQMMRRGLALAFGLGAVWAVAIVLARGWIVTAFQVPVAMVPETLEAMLIFASAVLLAMPAQSLMGLLQGFERFDLSNASLVSGVVAHVISLWTGLAAGGGLRAAALAGVIGQAVTAGTAAVLLRGQLRQHVGGSEPGVPSWREMMSFGAALQLAGILFALQFQSGKMLLGLLGNLTMVSDYELGFRVGNAVGSLPTLLMLSVIPTVARAWQAEGRDAVAALFLSTSRWVYAQAAVVLGLLWLLAPDIVAVWLGKGHDPVVPLIRAWGVGYFVILAWGPGTVVARGMGIPWFEVWGMLVSLIANAALCFWWIPRFGPAGAVAALGVSFVPAFALFASLFHANTGIAFWPWFRREFLPRLGGGIVAVFLCTLVLESGIALTWLPAPGIGRACVVTLLFMLVFIPIFALLGDPQRMARALRQMTTDAWRRRWTATAS